MSRRFIALRFSQNESRVCVVGELHARGKALVSLIAESGPQIVGHVLFSAVEIERQCKDERASPRRGTA
ncbi:MAG: hypothetical protein ACRD8U_08450 [Pyrinomonadaceae bacterium]